ncbi:MAG: hypothetical protein ACRBDL_10560 [Alphaproteobacteria bacterium]
MSFTPISDPKGASKTTQSFIKEHRREFWHLVKDIAPFIILFHLITNFVFSQIIEYTIHNYANIALTVAYFITMVTVFLNLYIYSFFIINWHRLIIARYNQTTYQQVSLLKPQKDDLAFIKAIIGLAIAYALLAHMHIILPIHIKILYPNLLSALTVIAVIYLSIAYYKCSFFCLAKLTNKAMTLPESYDLASGYFGKIILSYLNAIAKIGILFILYLFIGYILMEQSLEIVKSYNPDIGTADFLSTSRYLTILIGIPSLLFFKPMFIVIGVTITTNYYLHAIRR